MVSDDLVKVYFDLYDKNDTLIETIKVDLNKDYWYFYAIKTENLKTIKVEEFSKAFSISIEKGYEKFSDFFRNTKGLDFITKYSHSSLIEAIKHNQIDFARALIENKSDINLDFAI